MRHRLKLLLLLISWIAWAGCAGAAASTVGAETEQPAPHQEGGRILKTPAIEVVESAYDFGEAFEGEMVSHDFKVKNTGLEALEINQVRPG